MDLCSLGRCCTCSTTWWWTFSTSVCQIMVSNTECHCFLSFERNITGQTNRLLGLSTFTSLSLSVQINFFQDHTKVILCPLMGAVTYINEHREIRTYRLPALEQCGCSKQLFTRIKYAKSMIDRILAAKSNQNRLHWCVVIQTIVSGCLLIPHCSFVCHLTSYLSLFLFLVLYMCNLLLLSLAYFFCRLYLRGLYFFSLSLPSIQFNRMNVFIPWASLRSSLLTSSSICVSLFVFLWMRLNPSNEQQDRNSNGISLQQRTRRQLYTCVCVSV
jgi:hypothetical protein